MPVKLVFQLSVCVCVRLYIHGGGKDTKMSLTADELWEKLLKSYYN